jgi:hypothetical protein
MSSHTRSTSGRIRNRVLAQAIALAGAAATISTLAACGPMTADPLSASHKPAAAQSGSHVSSARHHAHRGHHHAGAPAAPNPGTAASAASAQPGPQTAAKQAPGKTGPKQGAQPKPPSPSAPADNVVRFGTVTSDNTNSTINVAPDGQALTALFSDLEAKSYDGVPSNETHMVIPLTGGASNATIKVYASGYVFTRHATARLSVTLNNQTIIKEFFSRTDHDFVLPIELPAIGGSAYQLSVAIDEQPSSHSGAAYINVNAIDAEIV